MKKQINTLYQNLMTVCEEVEHFYFVDQVTPMQTQVRIFTYRLGGYSDWLRPGALECRGIMFEMKDGKPVSLLCRPMEKFFNYSELVAWQKLDKNPIQLGDSVLDVMIKEDGSLISTFLDAGYLGVKSKASVKSDQAMQAYALIAQDPALSARLTELAKDGYTANMEFVSPNNRIVIGYEKPALVILNVRNNETGEYVDYKDLFADPVLRGYLVEKARIEIDDLDQFVKESYRQTGFEGYVIRTDKGFVKIKTDWYVALHRTKDSINNNKQLFLNIAENTVDDLKQLFIDDMVALKKIDAFETLFLDSLNTLVTLANEKVAANKGKSKKDFAIALSADMTPYGKLVFGPLMKYYEETDQQKLVDRIIDLMVKNFTQFVPDEYKNEIIPSED
ncbi:RNA ligase [Pantoea phage Phynn]|nr:RNA ligase [Pantoea phage Phynn]